MYVIKVTSQLTRELDILCSARQSYELLKGEKVPWL